MLRTRVMGFAVVGGVIGLSVLSGCSSGSTIEESPGDAGTGKKDTSVPASCTPNAQKCATTTISEVCSADGTTWVPSPCSAGETCSATTGVCSGTTTTPCTTGATKCLSSGIAEVCSAGSWVGVACATGQTCTAGACVGSDAGTGCTPKAQQCVTSTLSRVCPADGSGWLAVPCASGQVCASGTCVTEQDAPCTPGQGSCTSETTGFVCNPAGTAYEAVTCPKNTTCQAGVCMGAFPVGESECESLTVLETTTDGFTFTQTNCPTNTYCVSTGATTAACLAGTCTPDVTGGGCDSVCGDMLDSTVNQANYLSQCTATPTGFQWAVLECMSPQTCQNASFCGLEGTTPAPECFSTCTPGTTQCAPDGSGVQTCSLTGTWGTSAPCDPTQGLVCGTSPTTGDAYCGTPVCFTGAAGACTSTGQFEACSPTFVLATTGVACPPGETCLTETGLLAGAIQPGACTATCVAPSASCIAGGIAQCTADGTWGAPSSCTGAADGGTLLTCQAFTAASGQPSAVCGVCSPGTHQCSGSPDGLGNPPDIQTCGDNGLWNAPAACQTGTCQANNGDFSCLAECVPGAAAVCSLDGSEISSTCTASGTAGAFTPCTNGQTCQVDSNGNAIGCITCLGPDHGLPPQMECTTSSPGVSGTTDVDTCGNGDTWATPVACTGGQTCATNFFGLACETFGELFPGQVPPSDNNLPVTEANLAMFGATCAELELGSTETCGATAGCCAGACADVLIPVGCTSGGFQGPPPFPDGGFQGPPPFPDGGTQDAPSEAGTQDGGTQGGVFVDGGAPPPRGGSHRRVPAWKKLWNTVVGH